MAEERRNDFPTEGLQAMVNVAQKARLAFHQDFRRAFPSLMDLSVEKVLSNETRFCNFSGVNSFQLLPSTLLQRLIDVAYSRSVSVPFLKLLLNERTQEFDLRCVPEKSWHQVWKHICQNCRQLGKIQFPESFSRTDVLEDVLQMRNLRSLSALGNFVLFPGDVLRISNSLPHLNSLHLVVAQNFLSQNGHRPLANLKNLTDLCLKQESAFPLYFEEEELIKIQAVRAKIYLYKRLPYLRKCVVDVHFRISDNWDDDFLSLLPSQRCCHLKKVTLDHRLSKCKWPKNVIVDELHLISRFKTMENLWKIQELKNVQKIVMDEFQPQAIGMALKNFSESLRSLSIISYDCSSTESFGFDLFSLILSCPLLEEFQYIGYYKLLNSNQCSRITLQHLKHIKFHSYSCIDSTQSSEFLRFVIKHSPKLQILESGNISVNDILWMNCENGISKSLRALNVLCPSVNIRVEESRNFIAALKLFLVTCVPLENIDVHYIGESTKNFIIEGEKLNNFCDQLINIVCSVTPFDPVLF
ncbi:uncharacterized protein LOC135937926 [Cloeon dipterum]|uniref:uncharacterized protein LOC135937926 n=1 Tax=Cloeon dipterum TaxID=197152 RepID=UPI00322003CE